MLTPAEIEREVSKILDSRKYRQLDIPPETVRDLLQRELESQPSLKSAVKMVRHKMHNLVAPYLGDPDFEEAARKLDEAFVCGETEDVRSVCRDILAAHASTKERQPILEEFYEKLFDLTGRPKTILDLACGLHPFTFPWMSLPLSTRYFAYDLNTPRVGLINHYFNLQGLEPLAFVRDILLDPPQEKADIAFIFKEAHRMEQRQRGCNLPFWKALNVRWLLVSLPTNSLSGKHDLLEKQRKLVFGATAGQSWQISEMIFESEIVFCIDKDYEA